MQDFGEVCRRVRMALGLSQVHVARTGKLQQARVSEIEHGVYTPGLDQALKLAKGMGVKLADLVSVWEGDKEAADLAKERPAVGSAIDAAGVSEAIDKSLKPVLQIIQEIHDQTEVLALNAAVEAARVAEQRVEAPNDAVESSLAPVLQMIQEIHAQTRILALNAAVEARRVAEQRVEAPVRAAAKSKGTAKAKLKPGVNVGDAPVFVGLSDFPHPARPKNLVVLPTGVLVGPVVRSASSSRRRRPNSASRPKS